MEAQPAKRGGGEEGRGASVVPGLQSATPIQPGSPLFISTPKEKKKHQKNTIKRRGQVLLPATDAQEKTQKKTKSYSLTIPSCWPHHIAHIHREEVILAEWFFTFDHLRVIVNCWCSDFWSEITIARLTSVATMSHQKKIVNWERGWGLALVLVCLQIQGEVQKMSNEMFFYGIHEYMV